MPQPRKLVIVESPTKARKIQGYLGDDFEVEASVGHIRDLPQPRELPTEMKKGPYGKFAVDVDNGFDPYYVVHADKKQKVRELKKALKEADELYLATDEDREGEAIAWHLIQELKPKVPVKRMVFHEITREAIMRALENTRELDQDLVDAQETRRILDRLYGYEVSPVLWRKVGKGTSAGRVQSVATRLVVERERERMAFVTADYWDVSGTFLVQDADEPAFRARLTQLGDDRVASGRDFDDRGRLKAKSGVVQLDEAAATAVVGGLDGAGFRVRNLETKPYTRRPAAPFTTSTLQQEGSRKLRMTSRQTMRTAQGLYENGYITYMRTDSPALSKEATDAARAQARELYGADYVPSKPRTYQSKSKGAQEAHEAIRPAGDTFRTPAQLAGELAGDQFRLYELIWKRTVASQMADAKGSTATVKLGAELAAAAGAYAGRDAVFSASGTVITFRGFLAAYEESRDEPETEGTQKASSAKGEKETRLPRMADGDSLTGRDLTAEGHSTSPPARFTEASLVKALEERGIGRPSTYAAIISTIQDRDYVYMRGQALVPTWRAFAVVRLLELHFDRLVDYDFTATMEADLDEIAAGDRHRVTWLREFYFGEDQPAHVDAGGTSDTGGLDAHGSGLRHLVENLGEIDAAAINSVTIGEGIRVRVGKYGPYLEDTEAEVPEGQKPIRPRIPDDIAPDELTVPKARELFAAGADDGRVLGEDPATGHPIVAKNGRYGPYVTETLPEPDLDPDLSAAAKKRALAKLPKPRTGSLFQSMSLDSITLDEALRLLSLPRVVGQDPESGEDITAQNGRYGPYLKKGTDSRSLPTEESLFSVTLDEALELYKQPKRRGRAAAAPPLRELGEDPTSKKPIVVKDGRFGAYVTDGETNRTLPRDLTPETITPERAIQLLEEKRAQGPKKKVTKKPAAKKTTTAKKPAAKKATAAKSTAAKPAAKKPATTSKSSTSK